MEVLSPEVSDADVQDARTIGRKGTGRGRVEILARERRRPWTPEQKRAIVAESLGSELTPTEVARKYAISSGLLYAWRQHDLPPFWWTRVTAYAAAASCSFCIGVM